MSEACVRAGWGFHARYGGQNTTRLWIEDRYDRLRAAGMLTAEEMAEQLNICRGTVSIWRTAGLLRGHAYNKNKYLY